MKHAHVFCVSSPSLSVVGCVAATLWSGKKFQKQNIDVKMDSENNPLITCALKSHQSPIIINVSAVIAKIYISN